GRGGALRLVPAAPAAGRRSEVRAAHQADSAGVRRRLRARASPAAAARRRGARRGAGADPELAREPPETLRAASRPPSIEAVPAARYCATWIAGMLSRIESRISVVR